MVDYKKGDILVGKEDRKLYSFISVMGSYMHSETLVLHVRRIGAGYTTSIGDYEVELAEFAQTELYKALNGE
jgi:hypothetical protein